MSLPSHIWAYLDNEETCDDFYQQAGWFLDKLPHWWCQQGHVMKEFLVLFEVDHQLINEMRYRMGLQMAECSACVEAYYERKDQQIQEMYEKRTEKNIELFRRRLKKLDLKRLEENLQLFAEQARAGLTFEMLYRVQNLCEQTWIPWERYLTTAIVNGSLVRELPQSKLALCPGLYFLCLHPTECIRAWAQREVSEYGSINGDRESVQYLALQPCFERAIHILEQDALAKHHFVPQTFWNGLQFLLKQLSDCSHLVEDLPFVHLIVDSLEIVSPVVMQAAKCLSTVVSAIGPRFWLLSESIDTYHCGTVVSPLQQQILLASSEAVQKKCIELLPMVLQSLEPSEQSRYDEEVAKILSFLITEVCSVSSSLSSMVQFSAWQAVMNIVIRQFDNDRPNSCLTCSYLWGFAIVDLACVFSNQSMPKSVIVGSKFTAAQLGILQNTACQAVCHVLAHDATNMSKIFAKTCGVENYLMRNFVDPANREPHSIITRQRSSVGGEGFVEQFWVDYVWQRLLEDTPVKHIPEALHILIVRTYVLLGIFYCTFDEAGGEDQRCLLSYYSRLHSYLTRLQTERLLLCELIKPDTTMIRYLLLALMTPTLQIRKDVAAVLMQRFSTQSLVTCVELVARLNPTEAASAIEECIENNLKCHPIVELIFPSLLPTFFTLHKLLSLDLAPASPFSFSPASTVTKNKLIYCVQKDPLRELWVYICLLFDTMPLSTLGQHVLSGNSGPSPPMHEEAGSVRLASFNETISALFDLTKMLWPYMCEIWKETGEEGFGSEDLLSLLRWARMNSIVRRHWVEFLLLVLETGPIERYRDVLKSKQNVIDYLMRTSTTNSLLDVPLPPVYRERLAVVLGLGNINQPWHAQLSLTKPAPSSQPSLLSFLSQPSASSQASKQPTLSFSQNHVKQSSLSLPSSKPTDKSSFFSQPEKSTSENISSFSNTSKTTNSTPATTTSSFFSSFAHTTTSTASSTTSLPKSNELKIDLTGDLKLAWEMFDESIAGSPVKTYSLFTPSTKKVRPKMKKLLSALAASASSTAASTSLSSSISRPKVRQFGSEMQKLLRERRMEKVQSGLRDVAVQKALAQAKRDGSVPSALPPKKVLPPKLKTLPLPAGAAPVVAGNKTKSAARAKAAAPKPTNGKRPLPVKLQKLIKTPPKASSSTVFDEVECWLGCEVSTCAKWRLVTHGQYELNKDDRHFKCDNLPFVTCSDPCDACTRNACGECTESRAELARQQIKKKNAALRAAAAGGGAAAAAGGGAAAAAGTFASSSSSSTTTTKATRSVTNTSTTTVKKEPTVKLESKPQLSPKKNATATSTSSKSILAIKAKLEQASGKSVKQESDPFKAKHVKTGNEASQIKPVASQLQKPKLEPGKFVDGRQSVVEGRATNLKIEIKPSGLKSEPTTSPTKLPRSPKPPLSPTVTASSSLKPPLSPLKTSASKSSLSPLKGATSSSLRPPLSPSLGSSLSPSLSPSLSSSLSPSLSPSLGPSLSPSLKPSLSPQKTISIQKIFPSKPMRTLSPLKKAPSSETKTAAVSAPPSRKLAPSQNVTQKPSGAASSAKSQTNVKPKTSASLSSSSSSCSSSSSSLSSCLASTSNSAFVLGPTSSSSSSSSLLSSSSSSSTLEQKRPLSKKPVSTLMETDDDDETDCKEPEEKEEAKLSAADLYMQSLSGETQSSALARYSHRISQINSAHQSSRPKTKLFSPDVMMGTKQQGDVSGGNGKFVKQHEEALSLKSLHRQMLGWDINNLDKVLDEMKEKFKHIPAKFKGEQEYQHTFFPLLLEEARAGVESAVEEILVAQETLYPKNGDKGNNNNSSGNSNTSSGGDKENTNPNNSKDKGVIEVVSVTSYSQVNQFAFLQLARSHGNMFSNIGPDDLVLLWRRDRNKTIAKGEWQKSEMYTLACVEKALSESNNNNNNQGPRRWGAEYRVKVLVSEDPARALLNKQLFQNGSVWGLVKLENLKTVHREFLALQGCSRLKLFSQLLNPVQKIEEKTSVKPSKISLPNLNESQKQAVCSPLDSQGFTLIQGPPGTGKTTTIVSLIKQLVHRHPTNAVTGLKSAKRSRVLLCAPSNAAINEVTFRLLGETQDNKNLSVVRVGTTKNLPEILKNVSLDHLLTTKFESASETTNLWEKQNAISGRIAKLNEVIHEQCKQLYALRDTMQQSSSSFSVVEQEKALQLELTKLHTEKKELFTSLSKIKAQQRDSSRNVKVTKEHREISLLNSAQVVCATLSGAGMDTFRKVQPFDYVIIDEAAQAVEVSTLIPLQHGGNSCVLVGDPQQLPATVFSQLAEQFAYKQSLFQRLQAAGHPVEMLTIQYRMHPAINQFPSKYFYHNRLVTHDSVLERPPPPIQDVRLGPYAFFDVSEGYENRKSNSLQNFAEARFVAALYQFLKSQYGSKDVEFGSRVGVITPYSHQVGLLRSMLRNASTSLMISTVDSFQGSEKDFIIFSCVRANQGKGIGFLQNECRLNVALTRARLGLFVVGNAKTLSQNATWHDLIADAQERKVFVTTPPNIDSLFRKPIGLSESDIEVEASKNLKRPSARVDSLDKPAAKQHKA